MLNLIVDLNPNRMLFSLSHTHHEPLSCSPLEPSTSQTVCIRFVAVKDTLHTIDNIQLVDLDTGFVTNLRNVLEIYVESATSTKE